jgi:RNA polymerase sigma factor (sigma-70 family)
LDREPRPHDDGDLARRAARGDMMAFEALYRRHTGRVLAICLRLTGERGRAEEAVQDVFVRVWERLGSFRGESAFTSWLHRLAVNTVLQAMRSDRRRIARVAPAEDDQLDGAAAPAVPVEQRMDLEDAIARLPDQVRTVVVLHDVEGFTHDEIAAMTGVAAGTVRSQLSRARRILLKWLER